MRAALPLASFLALTACTDVGPDSADDMLELVPTEDKVTINLPVAEASPTAKSATDFAEYYSVTRGVTEHVNGLITWTLGTVSYVTSTYPPTWSDDATREAVWGPWSDSGLDPVETGVWVREEDDGSHTWAVFFVPRGGNVETDAVPVITGIVDAGSTAEEATGLFYIDFTTAGEMDPAILALGGFYVEYAYDPAGVDAVAGYEAFGENNDSPVDALYAYSEDYEGAGYMDLAWLEEISGSGSEELLTMRTRWEATGDGRSDATVSGGDLGDTVVYASECWGNDFQTSFWTDTIGYREGVGAESDCAFSEAEYASEASFSFVNAK